MRNTRGMKASAAVATLLISFVSTTACAQESSPPVDPEYHTESSMQCGSTNVRVVTYCEEDKTLGAACFLQKVVFTNSHTKQASRRFYLYEHYKKDMSLIASMFCVKKGNGTGIVLHSANLGNCVGCEWDDYFNEAGSFMGSDRTLFGPTNFKTKPVPDSFYEKYGFILDADGRFVELANVDVPRGRPRGR